MELTLTQARCEVRVALRGYESVTETIDLSEGGVIKNYKLNPMAAANVAPGQKMVSSAIPTNMTAKEIDKKISKAKSTRTWGWIITVPSIAWTGFMIVGLISVIAEDELDRTAGYC